jgi:hypothetical protein
MAPKRAKGCTRENSATAAVSHPTVSSGSNIEVETQGAIMVADEKQG